jgi:glycosyltransferase involved in cell wall biosynthesis
MKISVIVPAYNAAKTLPDCLNAIFSQQDGEVLVVDDCSTDDTRKIAENAGARVLRTQHQSGPAAARNLAADHATGEILFFVDSDVVIANDAIRRVLESFESNPNLAAVFGSYDDSPAQRNFLSQYKNLLHHYVHQESSSRAGTFWAGCGAVRSQIFHQVGGFDAVEYPYPSIEDIDLGIRVVEKGGEILLNKNLQGKHLKRWTISSLLKADILHRAIPWSRLIATQGVLPAELNLKIHSRISGIVACLFILFSVLCVIQQTIWIAIAASICLISILILNRPTYSFFLRKKGVLFTVGAIFWHIIYYFYSTFTFMYCWIRYRILAGKTVTARMRARRTT